SSPPRSPTSAPTRHWSASRWRRSPPPANSAPTATRASGTAWTPTRTPSSSTTSGAREKPRGPPAVLMGRRLQEGLSFRPVNTEVRQRWDVNRALVTGGHGFVGSHLAAGLLAAGTAVRVLDRPSPRQTDLGGPRTSGLDLLGLRAEVELV